MIFWHPTPLKIWQNSDRNAGIVYLCTRACRMRKYTLRFESICFFLDIGRPATAADFLETYWFSSLLHTDVATVCENRTIYTDFVKASYSFCSSRINQLFKFYYLTLKWSKWFLTWIFGRQSYWWYYSTVFLSQVD